jgi:hypothetical protein
MTSPSDSSNSITRWYGPPDGRATMGSVSDSSNAMTSVACHAVTSPVTTSPSESSKTTCVAGAPPVTTSPSESSKTIVFW